MDEVAIFTYSLSEIQVQNLFYAAIGAPTLATLNESWDGRQMTLSWTQGSLLESTNLAGPWTANLATSPYSVTPLGTEKFYRLNLP
jgi:hypothetical protein